MIRRGVCTTPGKEKLDGDDRSKPAVCRSGRIVGVDYTVGMLACKIDLQRGVL
jgi:hypothetical protein